MNPDRKVDHIDTTRSSDIFAACPESFFGASTTGKAFANVPRLWCPAETIPRITFAAPRNIYANEAEAPRQYSKRAVGRI